jgi:hypothetical protein
MAWLVSPSPSAHSRKPWNTMSGSSDRPTTRTQGVASATTSGAWCRCGITKGSSWLRPASSTPTRVLSQMVPTSRWPSAAWSPRPLAAATRGTAPMLMPRPSTSSTVVVLTPTLTAASGSLPVWPTITESHTLTRM